MYRFVTPTLLFIAFLLLLLVSLSVPIIHSIYLLDVKAAVATGFGNIGANSDIRFGVWGYCISAIRETGFGISRTQAGRCSPKKLGYTFDSTLLDVTGLDDLGNVIVHGLTLVLILHPIACVLTFITFLVSLHAVARVHRVTSFITTGIGIFAAILTTIVFLIDVILVAVARSRIRNASDGAITITWGNAVWMTLGATIALWAACVGACTGIFAIRRREKSYDEKPSNRY
jgi:hypothetical protein